MIFICDVMLGKLARYLRVLGFDTRYVRRRDDLEAFPAPSVESFFLTRRQGRGTRPHTVVVLDDNPEKQLLEIRDIVEQHVDRSAFMTRCLECNTPLVDAPKEKIEPFVPEYIYHHHDRFKTCPSCRKVYWEGSHAHEMHEWIGKLIEPDGS